MIIIGQDVGVGLIFACPGLKHVRRIAIEKSVWSIERSNYCLGGAALK